jgi:hypothetical protein
MASQMMFMAHYGKVTLREKLVEKNGRLMPDLPGAIPHLTLGWSTFNPVYVVEKLKAMRVAQEPPPAKESLVFDVKELYQLWSNTVYPATDADNWFVSATAAYWQMMSALPADQPKAMTALRDQLTESSCRLQYVTQNEGLLAPSAATRRYDLFGPYLVPRIRGTFALHQLRLMLGNQVFSQVMNGIHGQFDGKPVATAKLISRAEEDAGAVRPAMGRSGRLPRPRGDGGRYGVRTHVHGHVDREAGGGAVPFLHDSGDRDGEGCSLEGDRVRWSAAAGGAGGRQQAGQGGLQRWR